MLEPKIKFIEICLSVVFDQVAIAGGNSRTLKSLTLDPKNTSVTWEEKEKRFQITEHVDERAEPTTLRFLWMLLLYHFSKNADFPNLDPGLVALLQTNLKSLNKKKGGCPGIRMLFGSSNDYEFFVKNEAFRNSDNALQKSEKPCCGIANLFRRPFGSSNFHPQVVQTRLDAGAIKLQILENEAVRESTPEDFATILRDFDPVSCTVVPGIPASIADTHPSSTPSIREFREKELQPKEGDRASSEGELRRDSTNQTEAPSPVHGTEGSSNGSQYDIRVDDTPTARSSVLYANDNTYIQICRKAIRKYWPIFAVVVLVAIGLSVPQFFATSDTATGGSVNVFVERFASTKLLGLNQLGALPICTGDKFNIDVTVSPAAYVYVVWIDPGHDVTPVFPWDPKIGWGSRSNSEKPLEKPLTLPTGTDRRYEAPETKTGIATIVMFATKSPLSLTDTQLSDIFSGLPELPLPDNEEQGVVWFENYREVRDPDLVRTFKVVESGNPFARWQSQLQEKLGENVIYQTSVSFARLGRDR